MSLSEECSARIARLQEQLQQKGLDGALFIYPIDFRPFPRSKEFASLFEGENKIGMTFDVTPLQQYNYYNKLLPGQTIAIEPKCVFPGLGSIGIENSFAVTSRGGEKLTPLADDLVSV